MTFGFPCRFQELHWVLLGLLGRFCFARLGQSPMGCWVLHHHGISVIVSRFTFFTYNFVICSDQISEIFRSGHDNTSAFSARRPCDFGPLAYLHWEFCDPQVSNHQIFRFGYDCTSASSCKKPLLFSSSSRCCNMGLSGNVCGHHACPSLVPLLLATP